MVMHTYLYYFPLPVSLSRLTAVPGVRESNRAADKSFCVFHENHRDMQFWARAATLAAEPRSSQPSILQGTVNEYERCG